METLHTDIAVIGGGASGIACGISAAETYKANHKKVRIAIIEKGPRVGKKLLATGNGRCNLTNLHCSTEQYHGSFQKGIAYLLAQYPPQFIIEWFARLGLYCKADGTGRVYPYCKQATAVLDVLRLQLANCNIQELCDTAVTNITAGKNGFTIHCGNKIITAEKVVIAAGGKASPKLGSDGSCFPVIKALGHTITSLSPCLVPVTVTSGIIKSLKGVRCEGTVSVIAEGTTVKTEQGEIQFTETALSGICLFNLSACITDNCILSVALLPHFTHKEVETMMYSRIKLFKQQTADNLFTGLFHRRIGQALLKECGIPAGKPVSQLSKQETEKLIQIINNWTFHPKIPTDFSNAQVTKGGVTGGEINYKTMESRIVKNLFFCGEAIDVNGDCGGYNLQFAFSSGILAGEML